MRLDDTPGGRGVGAVAFRQPAAVGRERALDDIGDERGVALGMEGGEGNVDAVGEVGVVRLERGRESLAFARIRASSAQDEVRELGVERAGDRKRVVTGPVVGEVVDEAGDGVAAAVDGFPVERGGPASICLRAMERAASRKRPGSPETGTPSAIIAARVRWPALASRSKK